MRRSLLVLGMLTGCLLLSCDDPTPYEPVWNANAGTGTAPTVTTSKVQGTYLATSDYLYDGAPFFISIFKNGTVRTSPVGKPDFRENDWMYEGSLSSSGTLYLKDENDPHFKMTGTLTNNNNGTIKLISNDKSIFTTSEKVDDGLMQIDEDDYYGTATFLANAGDDYIDDSYFEFVDESGNGFYFAERGKLVTKGISGLDDGTYDYYVSGNRITVYKQGVFVQEEDPLKSFNYIITRPNDKNSSYTSHYLWMNGAWYQQKVLQD